MATGMGSGNYMPQMDTDWLSATDRVLLSRTTRTLGLLEAHDCSTTEWFWFLVESH